VVRKKTVCDEDTPLNWLVVRGARQHNLKGIDVPFPLGAFSVVSGVSGSGKSSLINDILYKTLARQLHRAQTVPGAHDRIDGVEFLNKVIRVDQQPLGQTPTSNPATYTGVFDIIRDYFARLPDAKIRGYSPRRFSFNVPGGRCEKCEGAGQLKIEMHFLPDVWITCDACSGKRYEPQTLEVKYKEHSIADVLEMSCADALQLFGNIPEIRRVLKTLCDVGLDYLSLGQSAPTLSGGEAQRIKLATELARPDTGRTLYLLDEPTTGLHFDDLKKLLDVLHRLVDLGNTVIVIEHNLDVIKNADWIVDLGPDAGQDGGQLVFAGTPEELAQRQGKLKVKNKRTIDTFNSHTAAALVPVLAAGPFEPRRKKDVESEELEVESEDIDSPMLRENDTPCLYIPDKKKPEDLMPWKILGEKWHFTPRGLNGGDKLLWEYSLLAEIFGTIKEVSPQARFVWTNRSLVPVYKHSKFGKAEKVKRLPWAVIHTKRVDAVYVEIYAAKNLIPPERIRSLGVVPNVSGEHTQYDILQLKFSPQSGIDKTELQKILQETLER
jgi:excinuclease ABC subunit A